MLPEQKSNASWLACEDRQTQDVLLGGLKDEAILALPWLWRFWAFPHQLPPVGDWRSWVVMGGRGAGKTRAGAEWVRRRPGACPPGNLALRVRMTGMDLVWALQKTHGGVASRDPR